MEPYFRNYQINYIVDIVVGNVKKESKTLNTFQKLPEYNSQSPQYNRSKQEGR